ncbi:MAG: DUF1997 domain-containing protein [Cyanobacteria bacterium P01_F01_bin.153]
MTHIHSASVGSEIGPEMKQETALDKNRPMRFHNSYEDHMEINADAETYARYLDIHQEWFSRCAAPMAVNALDEQSYAITIGRYGAFDYFVEPKIGLCLMPEDEGIYRIHSVDVPDYVPQGYGVDFKASMELVEVPASGDKGVTTNVTWTLNLDVDVWFPRFVRILPDKLLQSTGDRLLSQIVRQVSKRLTRKVQLDFHEAMNLPMPQQTKWVSGDDVS